MKKLFILILIMLFILTGCSKKQTEVGGQGSVLDEVAYSSIDEMNDAASTNIVSAPVAGKTDERFSIISSNIAQYTFKCNGESWCVRASKDVDNDISGLYYDSIGFEKDISSTYYTDDVYLYRFFYDDTQYTICLDVKDSDITMSHFDDVCGEFQTIITGVKAGYDNELVEDGDTVVYRITMYNADGTKTIMETIYTFENDKMISILSKNIFETNEAAKEYYDLLIENGYDSEKLFLLNNVISSSMDDNLDFYSDYTKQEFIDQMNQSMAQ